MRKSIALLVLAVIMGGLGLLGSPKEGDASFHFMRIYGAMGGAFGDTDVQYVELRMTTGGQQFVGGHDICFYNADGTPYALFNFPSDAPNGTSQESILAGSSEFDAAWAAGTVDGTPTFLFNGANVTQIETGADVFHPIRLPAGKISFGTEASMTPAAMCQGSFSPVDSVAYGTGYTGTVNFGTKFNTDMPSAGSQAVRLTAPLCTFCTFNNSTDYSLRDVNQVANYVRNNLNQSGPITSPDTDGDGVPDSTDLCLGTAPAAPVDANGCSQAQVDVDLDGICTAGAPSAGPSPGCTGTDNCPEWENPLQESPNWTVPPGDTDCDGFHQTAVFSPRASETTIGTVTNQHCSATPTFNDEALPDAWPPDFNDNQLVNGADILSYNAVFGQPTSNPPVTLLGNPTPVVRFDLNGSGLVNGPDVLQLNPFFGKRCKPLP